MSSTAPPERLAYLTGAVLAGGQSRRMGQSKARLVIGGESLLWRVVRRLARVAGEVLVVGPEDLRALVPDARVIPDRHVGLGPLAGLEAAFAGTRTPYIFVVACDMPFVVPTLVRAMAHQAQARPDVDAVVLRGAQGLEHLHAVYSTSCATLVADALAGEDRSVRTLLARLRVLEVATDEALHHDPTGLSAFNANTPEEWARALDIARAHPEL